MRLSPIKYGSVHAVPDSDNVISLLHFNDSDGGTSFVDETGRNWTTYGNAQIDTSQSVFGGSSGLFDASGDYLATPHTTDIALDDGDFTIEAFIRITAIPGDFRAICSKNELVGNSYGYRLGIDSNGYLVFYAYRNELLYAGMASVGYTIPLNTWTHVCVCRSGGTWTLFIAGVYVLQLVNLPLGIDDAGTPLQIARWGSLTTRDWDGWIDEFRICAKAIYRVPVGPADTIGDLIFTPPAAEFTYP